MANCAVVEWFGFYHSSTSQSFPSCGTSRGAKSASVSSPVNKIDAIELQEYLNSIESEKHKWDTKCFLCSFLKYAFGQGIIKTNVGALLQADKYVAPEREVLTLKNEPKLLQLLPENYRQHAIALIYSGCRISELMRIENADVDREKKIIQVKATKQIREKHKRRGIFYEIREIPLLPKIENFTFPLPRISISRFQESFRVACETLGIKVTPHDMRHTFATRCDDEGIKEKVIQSVLGHKDKRMTQRYKDHKTKDLMQKEFEKMRNSTPIGTPLRTNKCTKPKKK